jgi:cytochrome c-type biogenesis protein CcmE
MSAMKTKHQRLVLIALAMAALIGAGLLAAWALRNQASYFYVPSELRANPPELGRAVRLGGMVARGSIRTEADGVTTAFVVGDGKTAVPVRFRGIAPCAVRRRIGRGGRGLAGRGRHFRG